MHDAKNLFFPEEAFSGTDWEVDKTLDLLEAINVIDRVIVVAVYDVNREDEYTKPGYESYGRSLVEEVKPLVDSRFRTLQAAVPHRRDGVVARRCRFILPRMAVVGDFRKSSLHVKHVYDEG